MSHPLRENAEDKFVDAEVRSNTPFDHLQSDGVAGLITYLENVASDPRSDKKEAVTKRFSPFPSVRTSNR